MNIITYLKVKTFSLKVVIFIDIILLSMRVSVKNSGLSEKFRIVPLKIIDMKRRRV